MFRKLLSLILGTAAVASGAVPARAAEATTATASIAQYKSIYEIPVTPMRVQSTAETTGTTLAPYKGKVLLIVNVASRCGLTPQYEALEALHRKYRDQGLQVLGFPSNDFRGQEPGTEAEIVEFCQRKYGVTFPLYAKVHVAQGTDKAPLFRFLTEGDHPARTEITWNFGKFLVGRDGQVIAHFTPRTKPDSPEVIAAIEKALAEPAAGQ